MTADEIIARLGLQPHPEGGHFREMYRAPSGAPDQPRGASTAIYFLLKAGERSHWHRVDADEVWHHYAGAPLELSLSDDGKRVRHVRVGTDFEIGELPQAVVPRDVWQAARSLARSVTGRWAAARWRRPSGSKASSLRRRAGSRASASTSRVRPARHRP